MISEAEFNINRGNSNENEFVRRNIIKAIRRFQEDRFVWNDKRVTLDLTVDQMAYNTGFERVDTSTALEFDQIYVWDWILLNPSEAATGRFYDLIRVDDKELAVLSNTEHSGTPRYWNTDGGYLRLYPGPRTADTLEARCIIDVSEGIQYDSSTGDGGTVPWFNEAYEMILAMTLSLCYTYYLYKPEKAQLYKANSLSEFQRHRANFDRLNNQGTGTRPWYGSPTAKTGIVSSL